MRSLLIISLFLLAQTTVLAQINVDDFVTSKTEQNLRLGELKNAASTNLFGVFEQKFDLSYERVVSKSFSLCGTLEIGTYSKVESEYYVMNSGGLTLVSSNYKLSGWGFAMEGRYYPFKKNRIAPRGFFTGAYYKHFFLNEYYQGSGVVVSENHQAAGIGIDAGYKFNINNFIIEPLGGYAPHWDNGVGSNPQIDPMYTGDVMWPVFIRIECRIGYMF